MNDNLPDEYIDVPGQPEPPKGAVVKSAAVVTGSQRIARFRGRPMILVETGGYPHFVPLHREQFDRIAYPLLGGQSRSKMGDIFAYISNTAEDLTDNDRYILFGMPDKNNPAPASVTTIWDTEELTIDTITDPDKAVWRSPYAKIPKGDKGPVPFIMSLAGNDFGVYEDIMQSIAPIVMAKKPDGVIWWVGDGANGKSTLMDALYKIFPGQLSSITVKRLTDGRDTPSLNGTLANIVKESSEGRVDDTEIYKAIGTHEDFRVHKFHSQDDITIRGNLHHIFSANQIPTFNDKGYSARRRTYIVPFTETFQSDPTFEDETFTPEMFGRLIAEMCVYARRIMEQGYRYKWSARTAGAKAAYDTEANNAEEYASIIMQEGVVAFESFNPVRVDYENWCADNGYVPLGIGNLRRAVQAAGFERVSTKSEGGSVGKQYRLPTVENKDLQPFGMGRPGFYTVPGFKPAEPPKVPDFVDTPEPEKPISETISKTKKSILDGKW